MSSAKANPQAEAPTLQQTQPIATQEIQPDAAKSTQEPPGWARITSISRGIATITPPLDIPTVTILSKDVFKIGRGDLNDMVIPHLGISGTHLELRRSRNEDMVTIIDRSTNGTWIDGERIQRDQPKEIDFGQKIDILRIDQLRISFTVSSARRTGAALLHGKYLVRRNLGTGAYAEVKLAVDPKTGQQYAMKIIDRSKLGLQANAEEQLITEVRILKSLDHHCIVRVHDWFQNAARFYIALDYMPAGDLLEHLLARNKAFTEDESKDIFCQLVEAVEYLHAHNVVHRDIKPENILLDDRERLQEDKLELERGRKQAAGLDPNTINSQSQSQNVPGPINVDVTASQQARLHRESTKDRTFISKALQNEFDLQPSLGPSRLRIKLTDFGLSKSTVDAQNEGKAARLSTVCGTPQYLAPEVLKHFSPGAHSSSSDREYGKEVDVWSIGAILFVILTMHTPFPENDLLSRALAGKYEAQRLTHFSQPCQDIIRRMLVVNPKERISVNDIRHHPWAAELFNQREADLVRRAKAKADKEQEDDANRGQDDDDDNDDDEENHTPKNPSPFKPTKRKQPSGQRDYSDYDDNGDDDGGGDDENEKQSQHIHKKRPSNR